VRIGMSEAQMRRSTGFLGKPDSSASASGECSYVHPPKWPKGVSIMLVNKRVARIDVDAAGIPTTLNVEVGDLESTVYGQYANAGFV
jgi:hypothetical protein